MANECFRKISNKKVEYVLKQDKLLNRYGVTIGEQFIGIGYYGVDASVEKKLLKTFIHPSARKHFSVSLMVINNAYIPPHIDNDLKLVMNLYVKTADATTYFWRPKSDELTTVKLAMQTDGRLFKEEELECVGSFRASEYDLWMLDVTRIHSVNCDSQDLRIAYCFQSNTLTYEDVLKKLDQVIL